MLGTFAGGAPLDTGIDELATRTSSCVTVVITSDNGLVIAALDDGSVIAEATGVSPTLSSVDGCTVVTTTVDGLTVVSADGASDRVADGALVALSPDGQWAVTASAAGRLLLTDLTTDPSSDEVVASVPGTDATSAGRRARDRRHRPRSGVPIRVVHAAMSQSRDDGATDRDARGASRSPMGTRSGDSNGSS